MYNVNIILLTIASYIYNGGHFQFNDQSEGHVKGTLWSLTIDSWIGGFCGPYNMVIRT